MTDVAISYIEVAIRREYAPDEAGVIIRKFHDINYGNTEHLLKDEYGIFSGEYGVYCRKTIMFETFLPSQSAAFVSIEGMYDNKDQNLDSINVPIQRKIVTTKIETHFWTKTLQSRMTALCHERTLKRKSFLPQSELTNQAE